MKLIKDNIVAIFLFLLTAFGGFTWTLIQKGSEVTINEKIDARIESKLSDAHLIEMLLNTDKIKDFTSKAGKDIKAKIIEDVIRKDSNKVSMRAFIGSEIGIRDEQVLPLLAKILMSYKSGDIPTVKKLDSLIKRHTKENRIRL